MPEKPACDLCSGTGWRIVETADRRTHAVRCDCFEQRARSEALRRAGVPRRYDHCDLASFESHDPSHKKAKSVAERYIRDFPVDGAGLFITGPCGVGKTHLAVAIARELVESRRVDVRFFDFRELLKAIQDSYNRLTETSEKELLAPVLDCELLVLDDLGAEKPSNWVRDTIAYILNARYKHKRAVIITTNLPDPLPEDASKRERYEAIKARSGYGTPSADMLTDRIGAPARSRLYEMCKVVVMGGDDYRARFKAPGVDSTYWES